MRVVYLFTGGASVEGDFGPDRHVRSDALFGFLEDYVRDAEGEEALGDPEIEWLLDVFRNAPLLPLVPLAEYRTIDFPRPPG